MNNHKKYWKLLFQYYWQLLWFRYPLLVGNDREQTCYLISSHAVKELKIRPWGISFLATFGGISADCIMGLDQVSHIEGRWFL